MESNHALRRLEVVARHITASCETTSPSLHAQPCSSSSSSSGGPSSGGASVYASATGRPSKYSLMHGEVSTAPVVWRQGRVEGPPLHDVIYETSAGEGIAKITINRPDRRNAFRPETVKELMRVFDAARDDVTVGVIIFTGKGDLSFCSGGDQSLRGKHGYVGGDQVPRLNVLDLQVQIRRLPKPVIAMVAGYAIGGGHVLHLVCDLTLAAENAVFGQTGPKVGSFDAGYGCSIMSRLVGPKKAREIWYLARHYDATQALDMGLVNAVVPLPDLEKETVKWCREILRNSPMALRVLKCAINAADDGHAGMQELAGNATLIFYNTPEAVEGREAYLKGKAPDFSKFPRLP